MHHTITRLMRFLRTTAIAGAAFILGRRSLIDLPTVSIAVVTFGLLSFKKIPEPLLILAAGVAGLLLFKG